MTAGAFHVSSQKIRIDAKDGEKAILHCQCKDEHGHWKDAKIDLDNYIGNHDGMYILNEYRYKKASTYY